MLAMGGGQKVRYVLSMFRLDITKVNGLEETVEYMELAEFKTPKTGGVHVSTYPPYYGKDSFVYPLVGSEQGEHTVCPPVL